MDEPESDLDLYNRNVLRELIRVTNKAVLVVSHDQKTLMQVDSIVEIKEQGIEIFGGAYSLYLKKIFYIFNKVDKLIEEEKLDGCLSIYQPNLCINAQDKQHITRVRKIIVKLCKEDNAQNNVGTH